MPVAPGDRVGRFEVLSRLGAGGMGEVFLARDARLGRDVAIKFVRPDVAAGDEALRRFEREARAVAALHHPNIVTIHDIADHDGAPYIVMEYVEGATLRAHVGRPIDAPTLLRWAKDVAGALADAHERGIVHRDLKPENVILGDDGTLRIVDFGLAVLRETAVETESPTVTHVTIADGVAGTLGYVPPESATGKPADHRSDQFSLGVMLYELATGRRPFTGENFMEVMAATLRDEPEPIEHVRDDLPGSLRAVIDRCLRKDPAERYESTRALLEDLQSTRAVPPTPATAPSPLPLPRTSLVGRSEERETIRRMIVDDGARLITLSGPGGSGKTRLGIQVGSDLRDHFDGRVFFIPLGGVVEPELVVPAIARSVGVPGSQSSLDAIQRELANEPSLMLLDNFEHVIGAAGAVAELLVGCPELTIIVTSREVLRVYGEQDLPVEPLAVPRGDTLPPIDELEQAPAVALFVDRARAASPDFRLTEENAASVVELCARLDGLPLALELAAARVRALTPQAMLSRLQSRLRLLTSGARDAPDRQRTLRATLDWGYELLDEAERTLFARLGVFVGGFGLESAEAVGDPFATLGVDILDCVTSLVDKSLVRRDDLDGAEPRFSMLETIREYALEKLGEDHATRKAHAAYFLVLAEEGEAVVACGEDPTWLETFAREHENFLAAIDWLTANDDCEWGLRMAVALFHFWERSERFAEGRRALEGLVELPSSEDHPVLHARALDAAGMLASAQSDSDEAARLCGRGLEIWRRLGDRRGLAVCLNALGVNEMTRGALDAAARHFEESLEWWTALEDTLGFARTLSNLAYVRREQGEHAEASRMYQRAAESFSSLGDALGAAWADNHRGDVAASAGNLDEAERLYQKALDAFSSLDNHWGVASSLADLGSLAARRGDVEHADRLYRRALGGFAALGHRRGVARLLEKVATAAALQERWARALTLAAAADSLRDRIGIPASSAERQGLEVQLERARSSLGTEADHVWREGASLPAERAVALALDR